jgi:hypothetical protein
MIDAMFCLWRPWRPKLQLHHFGSSQNKTCLLVRAVEWMRFRVKSTNVRSAGIYGSINDFCFF